MSRQKRQVSLARQTCAAARPLPNTGGVRQASVDEIARNVLLPNLLAANTIAAVLPTDAPLDISALTTALEEQTRRVNDGNMSRVEAMLMAQAHTLNAIFTALTRRGVAQEYLTQFETYMRLALKAQSQCRATLETLAAIKNPQPVAFVRQANIAHGPQQVNNNPQSGTGQPSRAEKFENRPNELLEQQHGERLDTGAAQAAVRANSAMAAVEKVHRPQDTCG